MKHKSSHSKITLYTTKNEAEEPEIKLLISAGSWKKQESFRKTSISALLTMPKPLCESQQTVEKFLKRWEHQTTLLAS